MFVKFLLLLAGIATSAAVINPPTILTPKAIVIVTHIKYKRLYSFTFMPCTFAISWLILISINFLKIIFKNINITKEVIMVMIALFIVKEIKQYDVGYLTLFLNPDYNFGRLMKI